MPLSVEAGKEAEVKASTDTEHRTKIHFFLVEHASIMCERSCFHKAGVQSLDSLRTAKK